MGEEVKPREEGAAEEVEAEVETAAQDADVAVEGGAGSKSAAGDAGQVDLRREGEGVDSAAVIGWCRQRGIGHIETSALDGTGVDAAMEGRE